MSNATDSKLPVIDETCLADFTPDPDALRDNRVVAFNNRDLKSRPFSLLRTQMIKKMEEKNWKLIGITSPTPGAGKSFLSANLGASLSRLPNRKTYLFDFDLRRSSLGRNFGMEGEFGLGEYLEGSCDDLSKVGRKVAGSNLSVYPCYGQNFNSFELLAGETFNNLIDAMRQLPDDAIVVCDMPPAFANDDAMIVGKKLDAFILVVEQGITNRGQVRDSLRLMEPTPCLGTVLNRYEGGLMDPYGYGYGYGKKYTAYYNEASS
jgi:protein-tyrosine kinase